VGAGDKVESRQIVAGYRLGNEWVVDSGLAAGERVVVEGIGKVRPGATVKPVAPPSGSGPGAPPSSPKPAPRARLEVNPAAARSQQA
jgi:membrane fusion protein (multidrug efflux system)